MIQPPRLGHLGEEPIGAAVCVIADDRVRARCTHRAQKGVLGSQAGGEGEPACTTLERGQALLERCARGIATARVLVAPAQAPHSVLGIRRDLVDRGNDRAGLGVGLLARVNRARLEAGLIPGRHGMSLGGDLSGRGTEAAYDLVEALAVLVIDESEAERVPAFGRAHIHAHMSFVDP